MDTLKIFALAITLLGVASCADSQKACLVGAYGKSSRLTAEEDSLFKAVVLSHNGLQLRPVRVSRQVVAGINYRYECIDPNKCKVEIVVYQPLPGNGAARITSVNGKAYPE